MYTFHFCPRALSRLAGTLLVLAAVSAARADRQRAEADVVFRGTSTLHDFEGAAATRPFDLELKDGPDADHWVLSASVQVEVAGMDTRHPKRDAAMRTMLDAAHFPEVEGSIEETVVAATGESVVPMVLRIRDQAHPVEARLSGLTRSAAGVSFDLAFPVSLKRFGLKPPSVLGFIRVGDRVEVRCSVAAAAAELSQGSIPERP